MRVEKNKPGNVRSGKFMREKINDKNSRGDEKSRPGGVERKTVMSREVGRDFRGES